MLYYTFINSGRTCAPHFGATVLRPKLVRTQALCCTCYFFACCISGFCVRVMMLHISPGKGDWCKSRTPKLCKNTTHHVTHVFVFPACLIVLKYDPSLWFPVTTIKSRTFLIACKNGVWSSQSRSQCQAFNKCVLIWKLMRYLLKTVAITSMWDFCVSRELSSVTSRLNRV